MDKLSVSSVQEQLLEANEAKRAKFEQMKKSKKRPGQVGKWTDHSTQITNIKPVTSNSLMNDSPLTSGERGKPPDFVHQADFAGDYTDQMPQGVFGQTAGNQKGPKTPEYDRMKPNQKPSQRRVDPDFAYAEEGSTYKTLWPQADFASEYTDEMPVGDIFSGDNSGPEVRPPKSKDLGGTTRPKAHKAKIPDLTRYPQHEVASPKLEGKYLADVPNSGAPKVPSWEKVKSGVLVRVNESPKARFDVISENVLRRFINNYRRFGYEVVVEQTQPSWKRDREFLGLVLTAVSAKANHLPESYKEYRTNALKRLHGLVQHDYSSLYETRDAFLRTVISAYAMIERIAERKYRESLHLFEGNARVRNQQGLNDVELLVEANDEQMALRLIRHKVLEHFGLGTKIEHIFVDGKRFSPRQIREWTPGPRLRNTLGAAGMAASMAMGGAAHADQPQLRQPEQVEPAQLQPQERPILRQPEHIMPRSLQPQERPILRTPQKVVPRPLDDNFSMDESFMREWTGKRGGPPINSTAAGAREDGDSSTGELPDIDHNDHGVEATEPEGNEPTHPTDSDRAGNRTKKTWWS